MRVGVPRWVAVLGALAALAYAGGLRAAAVPPRPAAAPSSALEAPDLAAETIDLSGPWMWRGHADSAYLPAATFTPPGHLDLPAGETDLWLMKRFKVATATGPVALRLGAFAADVEVTLDGVRLAVKALRSGLVFVPAIPPLAAGEHVLLVHATKSKEGLWWDGAKPAIGTAGNRAHGYFELDWGFRPRVPDTAGAPYAVYVPPKLDRTKRAPLVVALHGWAGSVRSFLPYGITHEADRTGAVVLFVEGGKTLYIEGHEDAILRAIDDVVAALPIDRDRIGVLGVSMGGAGALGVTFHYPDRFAAVVSYFGDSLYDMTSYVKGTLKTEAMGARYSVLHVPENALHLPVFLIHGRADKVCPFYHLEKLEAALRALDLPVRIEAPERDGHTVALVHRTLPSAFDFLLAARRESRPARVTYGKNHDAYPGAWWLRFSLTTEGTFGRVDATVDAKLGTVRISRAMHVRDMRIDLSAWPAAAWEHLLVLKPAAALTLDLDGVRIGSVTARGGTEGRIEGLKGYGPDGKEDTMEALVVKPRLPESECTRVAPKPTPTGTRLRLPAVACTFALSGVKRLATSSPR